MLGRKAGQEEEKDYSDEIERLFLASRRKASAGAVKVQVQSLIDELRREQRTSLASPPTVSVPLPNVPNFIRGAITPSLLELGSGRGKKTGDGVWERASSEAAPQSLSSIPAELSPTPSRETTKSPVPSSFPFSVRPPSPLTTPRLATSASHLHFHLQETHVSENNKWIRRFLSDSIAKDSENFCVTAELLLTDPDMKVGELQDLLQHCLSECTHTPTHSTTLLRLLQDVCSVSASLPPCFQINGVSRGKRIASGAEAAIYRGSYNNAIVAIRECHIPSDIDWFSKEGRLIIRDLQREIIAHWQLRHDNVLRLIGVYEEDDGPPLMVMPYMEHRSASKFLRTYGDAESYAHIITGATQGLDYLHSRSPPVIHGDIHDSNILVDIFGKASLCDFGLSRIRHEVSRTLTSIHTGGRSFFVAPEISSGEILRPTESSDIYSLAVTIYELGTKGISRSFGKQGGTGMGAIQAAIQGQRPSCPDSFCGLNSVNTSYLYSVLNTMWGPDPKSRKTAHDLVPLVAEISVRLETDFQKSIPDPFPGLLHDAEFRQLCKRLIAWYPWKDTEAGLSLIKMFHSSQRQAILAELIISAMSNSTVETRRAHASHIIEVVCQAQKQELLHPALLYLGLKDFFLALELIRLDEEALRDAAYLLLASGVSRIRVVEMCRYKCAEGQALIEQWDALYREDHRDVNLSSAVDSY